MTELKRRSEADALRYVLQKIAEFPYVGEKAAQQMQLMARSALAIDADVHAQCALDTERLDWLDKVNTATNERVGTCYGWKFDINHNRASLSDHNLPALHVRAAIDAARGYAVTSTERSCDIPPDNPEDMLESIRLLMEQCQRQRDALDAVLNWYGNDRQIAFPGKQIVEALGSTDTSALPSTE